jgi:hypothetical protein
MDNGGRELMTVQEAAAQANVTVKAIYYALTEGKLTRHEQYGRLLVDRGELAGYRPRAHGDRPSRRRTRRAAGTA